jgi:uncharacterized protein YbbC (DUF1343 family)/CubicO group peptidase (beta-lactamase class C family)
MKRFLVLLIFAGVPFAQQPRPILPVPVSEPSFTGGPALDATIEAAIAADEIPGGIVLVGNERQIIYHKAYGNRSVVPVSEPMTLDTIFDVASLTKVVATTPAIMKLVESGKVRLNDRVTAYLPEFQGGTSDITVRQLLTHFSGMRPDVDLEPEWSGYETGIQKALIDKPTAPPNVRFTYSDINFLLLGEIVARVSGKPLPDYAREQVFEPLGMTDTTFNPADDLKPRVAPTEIVKDATTPLRGVVHDPTSRFMGGIAGHAGLFSTAWDLAKFAEMMLNFGQRNGARIFSPLTIQAFTSPRSPEGGPVRALGWDIDSPLSSSRGDLFPYGSYGHTGFTGTSMWIDPHTKTYVIFLSNSVHPKLRPAISPLRARVANAAAAGLAITEPPDVPHHSASVRPRPRPRTAQVLNGIDVLVSDGFHSLKGQRVGLITNHTGLTRDGTRNIDAMIAGGVNLKSLFSPEHGIAVRADDENIGNATDEATGLPVFSLYYGANRRPTGDMLDGIDVLVFDIQDIGARFYTYMCTMKNAMEEAARRKIRFIVLDRPNPITGLHVEGPLLQPELESFIGCFQMPVRHGMTIGELARMMNAVANPQADLHVIRMKGWERSDWFDATGQAWIDPSPNMRSLDAALLYPGVGMLEGGKVYSVGRGTDAPFEQVGAGWMDGRKLAFYLNERNIPGIRVYPTTLNPKASNFAGETIGGVRFVVTDRDVFDSVGFGTELAIAIARLFPGKMDWKANEKLTGSLPFLQALEAGADPSVIQRRFERDTEEFRVRRSQFLLY